MATILRLGQYTFIIWSHDHGFPHVHAVTTDGYAKIRLSDQYVMEMKGMLSAEIEEARQIVYENRKSFGRKWREIHGY